MISQTNGGADTWSGKEGRRKREGREGGKEGRREGGKEGRREGEKERRREGGKEGRNEGGRRTHLRRVNSLTILHQTLY
jgi:hypothetical protein